MSDAATSRSFAAPPSLDRIQRIALVVGALGAVGCVVGYLQNRAQFFESYLVGWVFWLAIAVGCLAWAMIQHLTAGGWGLVMRRSFEAGSRTLPLLALLFLPFLLGMDELFSWARPEVMAHDELLQKKEIYLNVGAFWGRAVVYFVIWGVLAVLLSRNSRLQDGGDDDRSTVRMRKLSGPGLVIYVLVCSFASYDWLMSLEPHWFSSLYGLYFVVSTGLGAMTFIILVAWYLSRHEPMRDVVEAKHFHDYGKLTLALIMIWAYFALSQYLIIWSGNIPEFASWYVQRNTGGWKAWSVLLVVFHFFVPFVLLLSRSLKRNPALLAGVALYLLAMRWADLHWQAGPTFHEHVSAHVLDLVSLVAVGGLWLALFIAELKKRPLLPANDPFLPEVLSHE